MATETSSEQNVTRQEPVIGGERYKPGEPITVEEAEENQARFGAPKLGKFRKVGLALLGAVATGGALGWLVKPKADEGVNVSYVPVGTHTEVVVSPSQKAGAVAAGGVAESNPGILSTPIATSTPSQESGPFSPATTEVEAVNTVYSQTRQVVEAGDFPQEQKVQLLAMVAKLEKTSEALGRFEDVYFNLKEPDGTPSLYKERTERFKNVDFSKAYPGLSQEQALQRFWKEKLEPGFLKDLANIRGMEEVLSSHHTAEELKGDLEAFALSYRGAFSIDYSAATFVASTPRQVTFSADVDVTGDAMLTEKLEAEKKLLTALLLGLPNAGPVKFKITKGAGGRYDPELNVVTIGLADASDTSNFLEGHELGHFYDPFVNPTIIENIDPEKLITAMILREKMVNAFYEGLSVESLLSPERTAVAQKMESGAKLTDAELREAMQMAGTRRFLLDIHSMITDRAGGGDAFFGGRTIYQGWADLISKQGSELDRLATQNPAMRDLVADIRKRPDYYDQFFGDKTGGVPGFGFINEISAFASIRYLKSVLEGEAIISVDEQGLLLTYLVSTAEREAVAEIIATLLKLGNIAGSKTLGGQFLRSLE